MQNSDAPNTSAARAYIDQVVEAFYAKATTDFLIGYHFRHIADFAEHLPRISDFWEIHLLPGNQLSSRSKQSAPFQLIRIHRPLKIKRGEVGRWVLLFQATLDEHPHPLRDKWREKIEFFKNVFLNSNELF